MAVFLIVGAAAAVGWWAPLACARVLLKRRGRAVLPAPKRFWLARIMMALDVALLAAVFYAAAGGAAALFACVFLVCLLTACVTDLAARIIPAEVCAVMLVCGIALQVLAHGVSGLADAALALCVIGACCMACLFVSRHMGHCDAFGAGDLRAMPALCCACGLGGSLFGLACCSVATLAVSGVFALARAGDWRAVPMAPGLCVWFVAGVLGA